MVASFGLDNVGMYVGLLGSAFALAQLATSFFWGTVSDAVGRKPTMLLGAALLAACFACFGFCVNYTQAMAVHVAMGLLNGNAAVVPTSVGEITDKTNQSLVFGWLPVVYSLGTITGPAVGGLLVGALGDDYPFLAPNMVGTIILGLSVLILGLFFDETLETGARMEKIGEVSCTCLGRTKKLTLSRFGGAKTRSRSSSSTGVAGADEETGLLSGPTTNATPPRIDGDEASKDGNEEPYTSNWRRILLNRTTVSILGTYLIFQLSNIAFNCLYPVFAEGDEPAGRGLEPSAVGLSLSFAGVASIVFQIFLFQPIKLWLGNLGMYRWAMLGLAVSTILIPLVGSVNDKPAWGMSGKTWLYLELGVVLMVKNVCAVGGLASSLLLVCTGTSPTCRTFPKLISLNVRD